MSVGVRHDKPGRGMFLLLGAAAVLLPLAVLVVLRGAPDTDVHWESHAAHFWLVLAAAVVTLGLGYSISETARRRRDARLFLISLAFMASFGFLGLHALVTPDVLLGPNAGFELATPVGLMVAGGFAAASSLELDARRSAMVMDHARLLVGGLLAVFAGWGIVSLTETRPLDSPLSVEQLDGWQVALAAVGVGLFAAAALGYYRLYRRRRNRFVLAVAAAFALLAEAMLVIAWATNWRLSWWEWHVLMLLAFVVIAAALRMEYHEERFSALYLDQTLAGARDVSILFADLAGFTAYSSDTAPDEVAAMLNAYFERIVPLMERHGGEVHQLVGDEVMVIFNKAGDHPGHAAMAAEAAVDLRDAAAQVAAAHPDWPRFRIGVNSGEVLAGVVGGRGHRKHGVVGDTVNLAARLQTEAPVGEVLLGAETARRLPAGSLVERLPDLTVKGKPEPVEAYILRGLPG